MRKVKHWYSTLVEIYLILKLSQNFYAWWHDERTITLFSAHQAYTLARMYHKIKESGVRSRNQREDQTSELAYTRPNVLVCVCNTEFQAQRKDWYGILELHICYFALRHRSTTACVILILNQKQDQVTFRSPHSILTTDGRKIPRLPDSATKPAWAEKETRAVDPDVPLDPCSSMAALWTKKVLLIGHVGVLVNSSLGIFAAKSLVYWMFHSKGLLTERKHQIFSRLPLARPDPPHCWRMRSQHPWFRNDRHVRHGEGRNRHPLADRNWWPSWYAQYQYHDQKHQSQRKYVCWTLWIPCNAWYFLYVSIVSSSTLVKGYVPLFLTNARMNSDWWEVALSQELV